MFEESNGEILSQQETDIARRNARIIYEIKRGLRNYKNQS